MVVYSPTRLPLRTFDLLSRPTVIGRGSHRLDSERRPHFEIDVSAFDGVKLDTHVVEVGSCARQER
jgi:hypothetical protein